MRGRFMSGPAQHRTYPRIAAWSADDVNDVTVYLKNRYYFFIHPAGQRNHGERRIKNDPAGRVYPRGFEAQSILMPAALISLPKVSISSRTNRLNCSGLIGVPGSPPAFRNVARTSARCNMRMTS